MFCKEIKQVSNFRRLNFVLLSNKKVKTLHKIIPIPMPSTCPMFSTIIAAIPAPKIKIGITLQQNIIPINPMIVAITPPVLVIFNIFLSILQ